MESARFWQQWSKEYKWIWYSIAGVFILACAYGVYVYVMGADNVTAWERLQEQKVLESTVHSFNVGPFQLSIPAENYVLIEYFNGGHLHINLIACLFFITVLLVSAMALVAVITTLERFWYFAGMALFILFFVSMRIEVLNLFMFHSQWPVIILLISYGGLSYYFASLNREVSFPIRVASFLGLLALTCVVIFFSAGVPFPFIHLSVTGYLAGLILTVIFTMMVAHEIPVALVYITGRGSSKTLRHFMLVSLVYLANVVITCLHEMDVIHWNFLYLNPYLLLVASAVLGLWGFRLRENLYQNIMPFAPIGAVFYGALASISMATIAYLLGTSNDAALRIIKDAILFSHVGYGVIFMTYMISNFILMMARNIPVYTVLYKPTRMPHFTFRLAGLIAMLGFVFYSNYREYIYNGFAGFYNAIGDLYELRELPTVRKAYYEQAAHYGFENNHANYTLGVTDVDAGDLEAAHHHYHLANGKNPTMYSVVNEGNIFRWEGDYREAIKIYRQPSGYLSAGEINNNIGSAYGQLHQLDSAVYHFALARESAISKSTAETNFFAMAALEHLPIKSDSVLSVFSDPSDATIANALALSSSLGLQTKSTVAVDGLSTLSLYQATLLNNYVIAKAKSGDTSLFNTVYRIASDSTNSDFEEALKSSLAHAYYHTGNVSKALSIMAEMVFVSQSHKGKFNYIMGLWSLEQGKPELASSYFDFAVDENYKQGKFYKAIALSEARDPLALVAWDTVARSKDIDEQTIAHDMKSILTVDHSQVIALADPLKYQFCRYRLTVGDSVLFNKIVSTFKSDNYKAQALLDLASRLYDGDLVPQAYRRLIQTGDLKITNARLLNELQLMELKLLAARGAIDGLKQQMTKEISFTGRSYERSYYDALIAAAAGDVLKATKLYTTLGSENPFFDEGIIAAAEFFKRQPDAGLKPYNILAEAIQLNTKSAKLLKAYADEAGRMGFQEYAANANQRLKELKNH